MVFDTFCSHFSSRDRIICQVLAVQNVYSINQHVIIDLSDYLFSLKSTIYEATNKERSEFAEQTNLHNSAARVAKSPKVLRH